MNAILQPLAQLCDPVVRWADVGPDMAAEMLKRNTLNRPKKPQKIKIYVREMTGKQWPVTGCTIQFGKSGRLLDGQNRLQAIIDSGVTVRLLVVEGVDDDVFDVIDRGANRSSTDILVVLGYEGWIASTGAAAASIAFNLLSGRQPYSDSLSPQAVREFVESHPGLMESVEFMADLPRVNPPLVHSAGAALHFLMASKSAPLADSYMQRLFVGNDMQIGDMVLKLRTSLMNRTKGDSSRSTKTQCIGAVIKVWNALRASRNIVHIGNAFPRSDEDFPEIK